MEKREMNTKSDYSMKLMDPRWQKKRLEILERDNWACQKCGDSKHTLHVHHRRYFSGKAPWDIDNAFLITLCAVCHQEETDTMADNCSDLVEIMKASFFARDVQEIAGAFIGLGNRHLSCVVAAAISHWLGNEERFQELIDRYFEYLTNKES